MMKGSIFSENFFFFQLLEASSERARSLSLSRRPVLAVDFSWFIPDPLLKAEARVFLLLLSMAALFAVLLTLAFF